MWDKLARVNQTTLSFRIRSLLRQDCHQHVHLLSPLENTYRSSSSLTFRSHALEARLRTHRTFFGSNFKFILRLPFLPGFFPIVYTASMSHFPLHVNVAVSTYIRNCARLTLL
jgi:hypothetical protein